MPRTYEKVQKHFEEKKDRNNKRKNTKEMEIGDFFEEKDNAGKVRKFQVENKEVTLEGFTIVSIREVLA